MFIRHSIMGFAHAVYRTRHALIVPLFDAFVPKHRNVLAVLGKPEGKFLIPASNIVTDAGDVYYAQRGAAESPTNAFGQHEMCSAGTPGKSATRSSFTVIGSTAKAHASGYPKTDDDDVDNTGAGTDIVSFLASYAKADFNHSAISHGIIDNTGASGGAPLLTGYAFASAFEKTADDTLKVFVNHDFTGA